MNRRAFLKLPAAALPLWTAAAAGCAAPGTSSNTQGPLGWDEFLVEMGRVAPPADDERQISVDAYLHRIAALAVRLAAVPEVPLGAFGGLQPAAHFGICHRGSGFFIVQWRLEPGAVLPAHDHPSYSVCTLSLEGSARLRNFEIVGPSPADAASPGQLRLTHDEVLEPGRVNLVAPRRDNLHAFQAGPHGARGIDITTSHGPDTGFTHYAFDAQQPLDAEGRLFAARPVGKDPKAALP
ncbi:MAG: hypothetical protein ACT4PU_09750 [Planctomycetota bacterium]